MINIIKTILNRFTLWLLCLFIGNFVLALPSHLIASSAKKTPPKHMVLHFDLNKTIMASDKVQKTTVDDTLNILLAEKYTYKWDDNCPKLISYRSYLKKLGLSQQELDFKLAHFLAFLKETNHPLKARVTAEYQRLFSKLPKSPENVLESFYCLIAQLEKSGLNYSIVLRTFGSDSDSVVSEINKRMGYQFFKKSAFFKKDILITEEGPLASIKEIYSYLSSPHNKVIQDDYEWWNSHGKKTAYGKPLYIDSDNKDILHLFFDDHIKDHFSQKNIVKAIDVNTGNLLSKEQLTSIKCLIKADTVQAILNEDYYIKQIKKILVLPSLQISLLPALINSELERVQVYDCVS